MKRIWVIFLLGFALVACQPAINNLRLSEQPTMEVTSGTPRVNAFDKDSYYDDRREGRYFEWSGGVKATSFREPLRFRYSFQNNVLTGEYALGRIGVLNYGHLGFGSVSGRIDNGVFEGSLIMESDGCMYSLFGSVADDHIQIYAEPTNCPDKESQEWDLRPSS